MPTGDFDANAIIASCNADALAQRALANKLGDENVALRARVKELEEQYAKARADLTTARVMGKVFCKRCGVVMSDEV